MGKVTKSYCYNSILLQMDLSYLGYEILILNTRKNTILWDVTPCSLVETHRRFGGNVLHLVYRGVSHERNSKKQVANTQLYDREYGGRIVLRNVDRLLLDCTVLHY